jgi:hypothetical protein
MLRRTLTGRLFLLLLLCLPTAAWSGGLLINGDRSISGRFNYCPAAGATNAYTCTITPGIGTSYRDGIFFTFKSNAANTGAATLNVNGIGAKAIKKRIAGTLTDVAANDIGVNQHVTVRYDATNDVMQAESLSAASGSGTVTNIATTGPITGGPIVSTGTVGFNSSNAATLFDGGVTNLTCGGGAIGKVQVMDSGELQYCDGATTSVLHAGLPTQSGLTWNVTAGTCTGDGNGGKLTVDGSNRIICGPDNGGAGGSGDITDVGTCTTGACFTDATTGARLTFGPIAAPSTPAASKATVYVDSTSKNLAVKDDAGVVKHGVQTKAAVSGQFATAVADDGTVSLAAPTKADVGLGNVDNTSDATKNSASAILTNKQITPRVTALTVTTNAVTPNADTTDIATQYSFTAGLTVNNPTATGSNPVDGQQLTFTFKTAAPQTLTWGTAYSGSCGLPLPTGTTGDGTTYNSFLYQYNANLTKWCLVGTTKAPAMRVTTLTSSTTYACNADLSEQCEMAATGAAGTITISAPSGTPVNGQLLMLVFLCSNAQSLTWNAIFADSPNIPRPTTCQASTTTPTIVGVRYTTLGSLNKWFVIATN